MPLLQMKEVFTPLRIVGIKVFKDNEGYTYIKYWNRPRRKILN